MSAENLSTVAAQQSSGVVEIQHDQPSSAPVWLAIDIEKVDDYQSAPIVAFGVCLGDAEGNIIETRAWYPAMPNYAKFGERCKAEFWDKNPDLYKTFAKRAQMMGSTSEVYQSFAIWLNALETRFSDITILSDNPAYDLGSLDRQIEKYCDRLPIRYTSLDDYRCVSDWSEQATGMRCYGKVRELVNAEMGPRVHLAHNPEIDAEYIYRCSIMVDRIGKIINDDLVKLVDAACEKIKAEKGGVST